LRFYTLMIVQIVVFCTVTLSGLVDVYWHFRGTYCLHLQGLSL
jgi:hypothetical protein